MSIKVSGKSKLCCESDEDTRPEEELYYERYSVTKSKKDKIPPYASFIKSQKEHQSNTQQVLASQTNVSDVLSKIEKTVLSTYYLSRVQSIKQKQSNKENNKNKKKQQQTKQHDESQTAELETAFKTLEKLRKQAASQEAELKLLEIRVAASEFEMNLKKQIAKKYALKHDQDFAEQVKQSRLELEQQERNRIQETLAKFKQTSVTSEKRKEETTTTSTTPKAWTLAQAERLFEQDKARASEVS